MMSKPISLIVEKPIETSVAAPIVGVKKPAPTLYAIIGFRFLKGTSLLILALAVFMLRNRDLPELFDRGIRYVHLDPESRFFEPTGERIATITPANVRAISIGICLYGILLLVEGIGLAIRARWAVWLVIFQSAFFVPIELKSYIFGRNSGSLIILGLLLVNVVVMWYLFRNRHRLFHTKI
jgi:uncharacterized membrane protein (DUF2068 family)